MHLIYHFQQNNSVKVIWHIRNINKYWSTEKPTVFLKSEIFPSPDNGKWRLFCLPNGEAGWRDYMSIFLKAIPNHDIEETATMERMVDFKFSYYKSSKIVGTLKASEMFSMRDSEWGFSKFISKESMLMDGLWNELFIEVQIRSNLITNAIRKKLDVALGIKNEGTTWYLNSILQSLFIIAPLRKGILNYPSYDLNQKGCLVPKPNSVLFWLQRIFYKVSWYRFLAWLIIRILVLYCDKLIIGAEIQTH